MPGKWSLHTLVAHGRNSGVKWPGNSQCWGIAQNKSWFYITLEYPGVVTDTAEVERLRTGINDNALNRAIVMHGADYVSEDFIRRNGFLGRNHGCPAVPQKLNKKIIDQIKGGSCMFLYYPAADYIKRSKILNT